MARTRETHQQPDAGATADKPTSSVNRRDFLRRAAVGVGLFGAGVAAGVGANAWRSAKHSSAGQTESPGGQPTSPGLADRSTPTNPSSNSASTDYVRIGVIQLPVSSASSIAIDPTGALAVAAGRTIHRYDSAGRPLDQWQADAPVTDITFAAPADDDRPLDAASPAAWAATRAGLLAFDRDGRIVRSHPWPEPSMYVTSLAVHDSNIFAADAANRCVVRFDADASVSLRIAPADESFIVPSPFFDLAIDPTNQRLWIANPGRHRLERWTFDGQRERTWGAASLDPTPANADARADGFAGCCNPCHFVRLADGRFITCEKGALRVRCFDPAGSASTAIAHAAMFRKPTAVDTPSPDQPNPAHQSQPQPLLRIGARALDVAASDGQRIAILDTDQAVVHVLQPQQPGNPGNPSPADAL